MAKGKPAKTPPKQKAKKKRANQLVKMVQKKNSDASSEESETKLYDYDSNIWAGFARKDEMHVRLRPTRKVHLRLGGTPVECVVTVPNAFPDPNATISWTSQVMARSEEPPPVFEGELQTLQLPPEVSCDPNTSFQMDSPSLHRLIASQYGTQPSEPLSSAECQPNYQYNPHQIFQDEPADRRPSVMARPHPGNIMLNFACPENAKQFSEQILVEMKGGGNAVTVCSYQSAKAAGDPSQSCTSKTTVNIPVLDNYPEHREQATNKMFNRQANCASDGLLNKNSSGFRTGIMTENFVKSDSDLLDATASKMQAAIRQDVFGRNILRPHNPRSRILCRSKILHRSKIIGRPVATKLPTPPKPIMISVGMNTDPTPSSWDKLVEYLSSIGDFFFA